MPLSAAQVAEHRLCMGCGFCRVSLGEGPGVEVAHDPDLGHVAPVRQSASGAALVGRDFVCPGAEMDMRFLAEQVHGREPEDELLGSYLALRSGYAVDPEQRARSASGGIIPALLGSLFARGEIDAAYCVVDGNDPVGARGAIVTDPEALRKVSGSVYHPVDFGAELQALVSGSYRFAFVGLPCEIAALEMLKRRIPDLARRHILSIGLFCGGINTFGGIAYYLRGFGIASDSVERIEYRHGAWPGRIRVESKGGGAPEVIPRIRGNTRWKILRYMIAFQGYWMLPRCRMCPDQVSDFADIAVGDPHLPRFRSEASDGVSVIVSRTARGEAILRAAVSSDLIRAEPMSRGEVVESQGYTLDNRRHVQAYRFAARLFGLPFPDVTVYPPLAESARFRHSVYAFVDLMKVAMPGGRLMRLFYYPWQIFEYLFLTFTPSLIVRRVKSLLENERHADDG